MDILVTGAYGQLGSELKELSGQFPCWRFLFTDIDSLDITNEGEIREFFSKGSPDLIINCAAYTAVDKAEEDYLTARKVNALAPSFLAKEAKRAGAGFIHISTDYVFNGKACLPYIETDKEDPQCIYGKTKLEGERMSLSVNSSSLIIRTSWLYSSYGSNFVKKMLQLGQNNETLRVVFDQIGTPTYAADLAKAILSITGIFEKERYRYVPGIYHFSNEGVASWYDVAMSIFEISGMECRVIPVLSAEFTTPAKRPHYSVLDKSKIKCKFDLEIPHWRESLKICLKKLKRNC